MKKFSYFAIRFLQTKITFIFFKKWVRWRTTKFLCLWNRLLVPSFAYSWRWHDLSELSKHKLMKRKFAISVVRPLSSWWQQHLGKTYSLQCQNGVMASDSFAIRETKSCRQHVSFVLRLTLGNQVPFWLNGEGRIVNDENK